MKAVSNECRKANVSQFIRSSDLLIEPQRLFFITVVPRKRENDSGKKWVENVFLCMDMEGEDKVITDISNSALWRDINDTDPEAGQMFEFSAEDVGGNYPVMHAKIIKGKIMEGVEAEYDRLTEKWTPEEDEDDSYNDNREASEASKAGKRVLEDGKKTKKDDEEEININDIPF